MDLLAPHLGTARDLAEDPDTGWLLTGSETPEAAEARLPAVFDLLRSHPGSEPVQEAALRLLELTRRREGMLDSWAAFSARFPANPLAFRMHLRWLRRENRQSEGLALLTGRDRTGDGLAQAENCAELGCHDEADHILTARLNDNPGDTKARLTWVKLLVARGEMSRATEVARPLRQGVRLSAAGQALLARIDAAEAAGDLIGSDTLQTMTLPAAALRQCILAFRDRALLPSVSPHLGGIAFVTGSLGAGGAERQLTRIASALHSHQQAGQAVSGIRLQAPISLIITNVSAAAGNDFFLPEVRKAGIGLTVLSDLEPEPLADLGLEPGILSGLAAVLPKNTQFGLQRLVAHFRRTRPEVAYIWQDGAVLMAALAALAAQVPRIVVSLRGMPPSLRKNLAKDEFHGMYQALSQVPGVTLSSNSRAAAEAYADWIGVPPANIPVIFNAVDPAPDCGSAEEETLWAAFAATTADATHTMGGIFRFDPNKRPMEWVDFAHAAWTCHPGLRFVIIGEGALFDHARDRAATLGMKDRILFVGHSRNIGYWLARMSFLTLLSEFEGLPNVLIEAQLAGLPVISTPAGGATETFVAGRSGLVLNSARNPEATDFTGKVGLLLSGPARLEFMGRFARQRATALFAPEAILAQTVLLLKDRNPPADLVLPLARTAGARA